MDVVRFMVFRDQHGNRMVLPEVYVGNVGWEYCRHLCLVTGLVEEAERLEVVPDADGMMRFPHVKAECGSSGFEHGHADVWLIGGPEFDAIANAEKVQA